MQSAYILSHEESEKDLLEVLEKAKNYSRATVLKGVTQIENNSLEYEQRRMIDLTLNKIRDSYNHFPAAYQNLIDFLIKKYSMDSSARKSLYYLLDYFLKISKIMKYNLGNCGEHSFIVIDFLLMNSNFLAEIFRICGKNAPDTDNFLIGNHMFVVVNRDLENSDPADPLTWGKNCYIIDTWSHKEENRIYPAADYLSKLSNYFMMEGVNYTEPFDSTVHGIELRTPNISTKRLSELYQCFNPMMEEAFIDLRLQAKEILSQLAIFQQKLTELYANLQKKYGTNHSKTVELYKKIQSLKLDTSPSKIKQMIEEDTKPLNCREKIDKYVKFYSYLSKTIKNNFEFSKESKKILFEHQKLHSKVFSLFFDKKSDTQTELEEIERMVLNKDGSHIKVG